MPPRPSAQPPLERKRLRSFVPLSTDDLLGRYGFGVMRRDDAPELVELQVGDLLRVRYAGWFAVLLHLPRKGSRKARVYVGRRNGDSVNWGAPKGHGSEYAAVLDAVKLVSAFTAVMCGGD